jgi:superfamily II DNA or RNA helicase
MLKLTYQHIRHELGGATFNRGEKYFLEGRVEGVTAEIVDSDYVVLRSKVSGSGNLYVQEISLEGSGSFGVDIDGICSCPVGFNCKHVVAACLSYLVVDDSSPIEKLDVKLQWLDSLKKARQTEPVDAQAEFIAYLVDESFQPGELKVRYVECKYKKNGDRTKGRMLNAYGGLKYARSATDEDKQISSMLLAFQSIGDISQDYAISGELGQLCLSKMIATSRCFWLVTANPPLSLGAARTLQLDWREFEKQQLKLTLKVEPAARVLEFFPPHYFSEKEWVIGPVAGAEFNAREWALLHDAPKLASEEATQFSELQLTQIPDSQIPMPATIDRIEVIEVPVPCIYIETVESFVGTQHRICLRFRYAAIEIPVYPQIARRNIMQNGQVYLIQRDLVAELECKKRLSQVGLVSVEETGDEYWLRFGAEDKPMVSQEGADAIDHWRTFLKETQPTLESEGWIIELADNFTISFIQPDKWEAIVDTETEAGNDWFDLRFDLEVQGKKYPLLPLITQVLQHYELDQLPPVVSVALNADTYLELPADRIRPICNILYELFDRDHHGASMPLNADLRLGKFDALKLAELDLVMGTEMTWRGGAPMRNLAAQLDDFQGIAAVKTARGLKAKLRDYQQSGVDWLQFLRRYEFNGILADDMGLGKTVQVLAHLQIEKEKKRMDRPCLIIAPTSLMSNWRREVEQFTPNLSVLVLQGPNRRAKFKLIAEHDLIITTYPLLVRDQKTLLAVDYHYLVLDEAQVIKNHKAKASQLVRQLNTRHRLCMTGTPMENHLGELWAQFDFLMPGFLGDATTFRKRFRTPIENHGDADQHARLAKRIAPFLLRRRKVDVAKELPDKTEIIRTVTLGGDQAALYESIRLSMEKKVRDAIASRGLARSHITILDALLKLRQTCCDPRLLSLSQAESVKSSAKLELLMEILPEMLEEGRRILLFSQFTTMLGFIEQALIEKDIGFAKLTGQTRNRDAAIDKFRNGDADVFLISLKAGGVGLNLTEADTVIHYDPWWNPAAENQATDRAHRIGQKKPVFVYKLITENTLEEKILEMQARKQFLADASYEVDHDGEQVQLTSDDLRALFTPLAEGDS